VPGIIVLGTTGEFLTVSDEERRLLVGTAVEHVAGRIPVLVGAMNASTTRAVRNAREAEELGADGLMILPPYYYTPTDDEIFGYYGAICEAVALPIMLYNNPVTSNVDMSAKLVGRLTRAFENIRYIKEASMDVGRVYDVIEETEGVMNVFAGERIVESFTLGAVGYVNPYGNYIPRASYRIWDYLVEGRVDDARKVQRLINEMDHIIAEGHPTYGHQCYSKALAAAAGHPVGDVRPPLTTFAQLGEEGRERRARLVPIMAQLDALIEQLDGAAVTV
jgi:4-hydroxy-tetrahydrodipicolinate synthase